MLHGSKVPKRSKRWTARQLDSPAPPPTTVMTTVGSIVTHRHLSLGGMDVSIAPKRKLTFAGTCEWQGCLAARLVRCVLHGSLGRARCGGT
ncbi:hypothetical protein E2C01_023830 [Portunus trituberculatus]|uniref:Uncharacterized protein n=1 Tax=Portunus trituberculatus TaxID=210409 RepID=A0A5B7EC73_PORTR|nr:hypothetical protein [Portunus trituberculatus]